MDPADHRTVGVLRRFVLFRAGAHGWFLVSGAAQEVSDLVATTRTTSRSQCRACAPDPAPHLPPS
jgi:hypothetical protein